MISKFTTVYAGHVDLPDRGQNTTPANERRYSNEHLASVFEKTEAIAKKMDALGYHTLWLAEHHFQHEGYECIPNDLMLAVHLAHVTKQLKIGCAFNIAPMWHPLRLAEDFATADILTRGRTIFGVGRGYHTREVETFGAPMLDQNANRELFEEQVEIIFKAFNEESFSHKGKHYTLPPEVPYRGYELEKLTLAAVGNARRQGVVLALVRKRFLVKRLENDLDLLLEQLATGFLVQHRRAEGLDLAGMVAAADAEDRPAAGQDVGGRKILGQAQRMPHRRDVEGPADL